MKTVWIVMSKSYNFDDCNSYSASIVAACESHEAAIEATNNYSINSVGGIAVEWNSDMTGAKIGVVVDIEIEEMTVQS